MNVGRLLTSTAWATIALMGMTGCGHPYQRFVPYGDGDITLALDTKTGQTCATVPKNADLGKSIQRAGWPFCYDLYKESK